MGNILGMRVPCRWLFLPLLAGLLVVAGVVAVAEKPAADLRNVRYGPVARQRLDVWKAAAGAPAPVCIFFHGGGFLGGDKTNFPDQILHDCLARHIAVVSVDYGLANARDHATFPTPMLDSARAVQFVRSQAAAWGIDPTRVAVCGYSAGGCIALWIALHPDLADPRADDPVARCSSRVACAIAHAGQTTVDPHIFRTVFPTDAPEPYRAFMQPFLPLFGVTTVEELETPRLRKIIEDASPITWVSAAAPPIYLAYYSANTPLPLPPNARSGDIIHHPFLGVLLKNKLDALAVHCECYYGADPQHKEPADGDLTFLQRFLVQPH